VLDLLAAYPLLNLHSGSRNFSYQDLNKPVSN